MSGSKEIRAGGAAVEVSAKDKLSGSLSRISARFKNFAAGIKSIGGRLASDKIALGSIITGAISTGSITGAIKSFATAGAALQDMSNRTGLSVEQLSKLKYAAGLTGAELEDVEVGLKGMDKFMGKVAAGGDEAAATLKKLGVSAGALKGLSPDQTFAKLAKAVGAVEDPIKRNYLALQVFGKGGLSLVPIATHFDELGREAENLGVVMSAETAANAKDLDDALYRLGVTSKGIFSAIGSIFVKDVTAMAERVMTVVISVRNWIRANKQFVGSILRVVTLVAAVGTGIIALGLGISMIGMAFGGLATLAGLVGTGFTMVMTAIGALLSPIGLVVAAVVGIGAYFLYASGSAGEAVDFIKGALGGLVADTKSAFGAIAAAMAAGNLGAAAAVLWALLKLEWTKGLNWLNGAWNTAIANMFNMWAAFSNGIVDVFALSTRSIVDLWQKVEDKITDFMLKNASKGGWLGKALIGFNSGGLIDSSGGRGGKGVDMQAEAERDKKIRASQRRLGIGTDSPSTLEEAQRAARQQTAATADGLRKKLDQLARDAQAPTNARSRTDVDAADKALAEAQAAFEAAKAVANALTPMDLAKAKPGQVPKSNEDLADVEAAGKSAGTFSAAAAGRLGNDSLAERTAKATERTADNTQQKKFRGEKAGMGFA